MTPIGTNHLVKAMQQALFDDAAKARLAPTSARLRRANGRGNPRPRRSPVELLGGRTTPACVSCAYPTA